MIKFDCQSVDLGSVGHHEDVQIFVTDDVDFSMNIPASWFSIHLREILRWINADSKSYFAYELDSDWGIAFSKENHHIRIADWKGSSPELWRLYSGVSEVNPAELTSAISSYLNGCGDKHFHAPKADSSIAENKITTTIRNSFNPPFEFFMEQNLSLKKLLSTVHGSESDRIWLHGNHFPDSRFTNRTTLENTFAVQSEKQRFITYALRETFSTYQHFVSLDRIGFPSHMLECKQVLVPMFQREQIVQLVLT